MWLARNFTRVYFSSFTTYFWMGIFLINFMVMLFSERIFYFPSEEFSRIWCVYLLDTVFIPDFVCLWLMDWYFVVLLRQKDQSVEMHSCHLGYDWWIARRTFTNLFLRVTYFHRVASNLTNKILPKKAIGSQIPELAFKKCFFLFKGPVTS